MRLDLFVSSDSFFILQYDLSLTTVGFRSMFNCHKLFMTEWTYFSFIFFTYFSLLYYQTFLVTKKKHLFFWNIHDLLWTCSAVFLWICKSKWKVDVTLQNLVIAKQDALFKSISFNSLGIESMSKDKSIYQIVLE